MSATSIGELASNSSSLRFRLGVANFGAGLAEVVWSTFEGGIVEIPVKSRLGREIDVDTVTIGVCERMLSLESEVGKKLEALEIQPPDAVASLVAMVWISFRVSVEVGRVDF